MIYWEIWKDVTNIQGILYLSVPLYLSLSQNTKAPLKVMFSIYSFIISFHIFVSSQCTYNVIFNLLINNI